MKVARLLCTAFAVTLIAGWATGLYACDKDKTSAAGTVYQASATGKTAVSPHACSAEMAAQCTPEMAAACKAKMSAAAAGCPAMKASAVTASANGSCSAHGMKASAVTASANGSCSAHGMKASAVTASANGSCSAKGTSATAVLASTSGGDACCASKGSKGTKASAASAKSAGSCATKGATAAAGQCNAHGMGAMAANNPHDGCDACLDMTDCSDALDAIGAHRQAVRLKNGVMYVYTADTQRNVSAVQAAVARRGQHMAQFASAGDKARLCAECKSMRGAMASGKLTREVVNIEGGSLTLITSTDPAIVAKIHAMAEPKLMARSKS